MAPEPIGFGAGMTELGLGIGAETTGLLVRRNSGRNQSEPAVPDRKTTSMVAVLFGDSSTFHNIVEPCNVPVGSLRMYVASGGMGNATTPFTDEEVLFSAVIS